MALPIVDFNRISFDEANPGLVGAERGQNYMQNAIKFPQALQKNMADIQQSIAAAHEAQSGANKNDFLIKNPQYISPEGMIISQAIENQKKQQSLNNNQPPGNMIPENNGDIAKYEGSNYNTPTGSSFSKSQYHPDAMAFNPPKLQSPTGNPQLDSMYYKNGGMNPIDKAKLDLAQSQSQKYQQENIERNKDFNNQAVFANQSTLDAHNFIDALMKTTALERGPLGGSAPGLSDAAQRQDAYGENMVVSASKLFQGSNAVRSADIKLNEMAKPNRKQNKEVAFDLAEGVIAKNDRFKDRQQFYSKGTTLGLKPEILDAMWGKYETERPYFNTETKMPNDAYKGSYMDYLNPEAVNAFINGQEYSPTNNKQLKEDNWSSKDLKNVQGWAKKNNLDPKDFDKMNLYILAQKEGISLAQLKKELHGMGAF